MKENIEKELKEAKKELINLYLLIKPRKIEDVKYIIIIKYFFSQKIVQKKIIIKNLIF